MRQLIALLLAFLASPALAAGTCEEIFPSTPPTSLTCTSTQTSVTCNWTMPLSRGVKAYLGTTLVASASNSTGVSLTTFTRTGLTPGTTYQAKVQRLDMDDCAGYGDYIFYTIATAGAPPVMNAPAAVTTSTVSLTWSSVAGANSYTLYRNGAIYGAGLPSTNYTVSGLSANTSYTFSVLAVGTGWSSGQSNVLTVVTALPAPVLSVTSTGPKTFRLAWTAPAGYSLETRYRITVTGLGTIDNFVPTLDDRSYVVSLTTQPGWTIQDNTTYTATVQAQAYNTAALSYADRYYSDASNTVSARTATAAPTVGTTFVGHDTITYTWAAVTGATSYNVYGLVNTTYTTLASNVTSLSYTRTGLTPQTSYTTVIRAVNSNSVQSADGAKTSTTLAGPAVLTGWGVAGGYMLSWNIPPGATGFTIFDVTDDLELTTVDATTTQYLIAGYAPRVTRQYSVNTLLGASMTTSNVVTLTTSPATPATPTVSNGLVEQITMSSNLPAGATALQFSVNGQLYTAPAPGTALSLTGLPPCASYTVYARSIDALGAYSAWSAAATSRTAPPAPTNVALSVDGGNNLVISFAQPANAACVVKTRFRRGTVPGVYDVTSDTSGISSGHVDVSAASTYYYALFNEAGSNGTSPNSTEISNAPRVPARMRMRTGL